MHYQIREREAALQISKSRELFFWLSTFYAVSMVGMIYRFVLWPLSCVTVTTIPSIDCRYKVTKRSNNLVPIVPFTFTLAYVADLAYGSKVHRIRGTYGHNFSEMWLSFSLSKRELYNLPIDDISLPFVCSAEADMIMQNESDLLEWPHGLPTVSCIDQARVNAEIEKKLHPMTP